MEAQLQHPTHGLHQHEEDPHDNSVVGSGGGEEYNQPGEKKSMLTKVKNRAKKIRNTITKQGHGDDNEDEEMVNAHSAPKYDEDDHSPVVPATNLPIQASANLEKPTDTGEDRYNHSSRKEAYPNVGSEGVFTPSASGQGDKTGPEIQNPLQPSPRVVDEKANPEVEPNIKTGPPAAFEEDPHSPRGRSHKIPPSNYQSERVTDPTGEGSHDQISPQPPTEEEFNPEPNQAGASANPEQSKSHDTTHAESMPRNTITGKIFSATSGLANKAISAKNVVVSKLGYGGGPQHQEGCQDSSKKPASGLVAGYGHKVAETLTPVYKKVVSAGGAVMSKVQGSGGGAEEKTKGVDKGMFVRLREYLSDKFKPGEDLSVGGAEEKTKGVDKGVFVRLREYVSDKFKPGEDANRGGAEEKTKGIDKGVFVRLRVYLSDKFKPGEDDNALSEATEDAFHKKNEGVGQPPVAAK